MSLPQKVKKEIGLSPDWNSRHPLSKVPWACRGEGKRPSRQTGGKSISYKWLASRKIWSVEELETLPAGTKPRTSIALRRERGSARRSSLNVRERAIVSQTNIRTVSKATLEKRLRDRAERIVMGFSKHICTIVNGNELVGCFYRWKI